MTETEFNALAAQGYNRIPVTLETFAVILLATLHYQYLAPFFTLFQLADNQQRVIGFQK